MLISGDFVGGQNLNTNFFFSQTFPAPPGISRPNPVTSRQTIWFLLGFEGHTELFGPHPFNVEDPHPTSKISGPKVWVWVPFSSLRLHKNSHDLVARVWSSEQTPAPHSNINLTSIANLGTPSHPQNCLWPFWRKGPKPPNLVILLSLTKECNTEKRI